MKEISTEDVVQRKEDNLMVSALGEDIVMMDLVNGAYLSLNKTGRIIWEYLEKPIRVSGIIQQLMGHFQVDETTCTEETLGFLKKLHEQHALTIS